MPSPPAKRQLNSATARTWATRLENRHYEFIRFRNGYGPLVPEMDVEFCGVQKRRDCYAIRLGKVLRISRWKPAQ